jgi:peptide deformylase
MNMKIVPIDQIPKETVNCPDNLVDLYRHCLHMENICMTDDGIGLSAAQIGVPWKLFVVRYESGPAPPRLRIAFRHFVDCRYEPTSDEKEKSIEGCLSLRNAAGKFRHFEVERFKGVRVVGKELLTHPNFHLVDVDFVPEGVYRTVFQHEIDHQNGVLISDIGKEMQLWK